MTFFKDLLGIPLFAWVAITLHVIEGFMSYPLEMNLMSFFHQKFSMDDTTSGKYVSINGAFVVAFTLPAGWVIDKIGLRSSLLVGFMAAALSRAFIAFSDDKDEIMWALNIGVSIGSALVALTLHIVVDCMDEGSSKNIAFTMLYSANNFGDMVASFANAKMIAFGGVNEFQWIFIITGGAAFLGALLTLVWLWPKHQPIIIDSSELEKKTAWEEIKLILFDKTLHKALLMAFVLLGVRTMFRHLNNILPLYEQRLYGPTVDYGFTIGLNPAGIIILSPLFGVLLRNVKNHISLIFLGTLLSAMAPIAMLVYRPPDNEWPVWIFMGIFTVGEALYSPKVSQLAISLPPAGKKGIYSSLMILPGFVGTLISGEEAGLLLDYYCPEPVNVGYDYWDAKSCANLWIIVMAIAAITPISILISGDYFTRHLLEPELVNLELEMEDLE